MNLRCISLVLMLVTVGCSRVSVHIEDQDESRKFTVPFSLVKAAFKLSTDGDLEIDDLGGISEEIDLKTLALAFREHGEAIKIEASEGSSFYRAGMVGKSFRISLEEPEDQRKVMINLPMKVMEAIADSKDNKIDPDVLIKSLKGFKGTLIKVEEPGETIRIVMK